MAIAVRGKNVEVTPALREYVEKRMDKLTRYFESELDIQALLSVEKDDHIVEITCFVDGIVLRGVENNLDMYAAIDLVVDKIIRQIHKYKTRISRKMRKENAIKLSQITPPVEVKEEDILIERRKHFTIAPMNVEEAVLQMNLVGHDFFMFFNAETEVMNVVYRRKNGSYGLIEPEV